MSSVDDQPVTTNLSLDIEKLFETIRQQSDKRQLLLDTVLKTLNQWKTEQIERIEEIYCDHFKLISNENKNLQIHEQKLIEQLKQQAVQPIENLRNQISTSTTMTVEQIQQTVHQVRKESSNLNWKVSTFLPLNEPKKTNSKKVTISQDKGVPLKRLVTKFGIISSIEYGKRDITDHIEKLEGVFHLPTIVCSYLTAWNRKSNIDEKVLLLTEYVTIIQQSLTKRRSDFDVILGIQCFFHYNQIIRENKHEMMIFLLQFFMNHQCLTRNQILDWYHAKHTQGYQGFPQAKSLVSQFIKQLDI